MMASKLAPDDVRFGKMLKFYQLNGYYLGLRAAEWSFDEQNVEPIEATGESLRNADLTHVMARETTAN